MEISKAEFWGPAGHLWTGPFTLYAKLNYGHHRLSKAACPFADSFTSYMQTFFFFVDVHIFISSRWIHSESRIYGTFEWTLDSQQHDTRSSLNRRRANVEGVIRARIIYTRKVRRSVEVWWASSSVWSAQEDGGNIKREREKCSFGGI